MSKVLVTGCNGQLGVALRKSYREGTDEYLWKSRQDLDITSPVAIEQFIAQNKIDVVVNCAAYTDVDGAESDFETAELVNCKGVKNIALAAKKHGAFVIHISTDYVFDGASTEPYKADSAVNPINKYGLSKLHGELELINNCNNSIIIRTGWLYSHNGSNFVKTISNLLETKDKIKVVDDQIGSPTYCDDLANFIITIIRDKKLNGYEGIYNYSGEGECSWHEFATAIAEHKKSRCHVEHCGSEEFKRAAKRPKYSILDKSTTAEKFGVTIPHWRDTLSRYFETNNCNNLGNK